MLESPSPLPALCPNTFLACSWTSFCGLRCLSPGVISARPGALCPRAADHCEVQCSLVSIGLRSGSSWPRRQSSSQALDSCVHRGASSRGFRGSWMPAHTCPWPWPWPHRPPDIQGRRRSTSHTPLPLGSLTWVNKPVLSKKWRQSKI